MTAAVVAASLLAGGCVPLNKYRKLETDNRIVNGHLAAVKQDFERLKQANLDLSKQLDDAAGALRNKTGELRLVDSNYEKLKKQFDDLEALYSQLMGQNKAPGLINIPIMLDRALRQFASTHPDLLEYLPEYGMVKLKSDFTFDRGSDDVRAGASLALGKLVEILKTADARSFHVYVAGHTDDIPISRAETRKHHPNNWYLSVHRAVAVQKVLTKAGLAPKRIAAMGFGEYHPIAPNKPNKGGNRLNRRVEIWIVPPDRFLTDAGAPATGK